MRSHGFVYILISNREKVYIGSTINPISRLLDHCRERGSKFDTISLAYIGSEYWAREVERLMIFNFRPVMNISCTTRCYISDMETTLKCLNNANFVEFTRLHFEADCSIVFNAFTEPQREKEISLALPKSRFEYAADSRELEQFIQSRERVCAEMVFKEALGFEGKPSWEQSRQICSFLIAHGFHRRGVGRFKKYGLQKQFVKQEA